MPKNDDLELEKLKEYGEKAIKEIEEINIAERYTEDNFEKVLAKLHFEGRNVIGISMGEVIALIDLHYDSNGALNHFATEEEVEEYLKYIRNINNEDN